MDCSEKPKGTDRASRWDLKANIDQLQSANFRPHRLGSHYSPLDSPANEFIC